MQDLIYKRGQAGVNKASVTIRFNNEDKNNSPETIKEVNVTRQVSNKIMSKYKSFIKWNCEWLIKSVIIYLIVQLLLG